MKKFFSPRFPFDPAGLPFFYGWLILPLALLGLYGSLPGQTMGISVFTEFLMETMGLSRNQLSQAYLWGTLASGLCMPWLGRKLDAWGARRMTLVGSLGLGFSLVMMASAGHFLQGLQGIFPLGGWLVAFALMVGIFVLVRLFGQGLLSMTSRNMLSKWFDKKRGRAFGLFGVAMSLGFSVYPSLANWWIERVGFVGCLLGLAALVGLGLSLVAWAMFRDNPEECGLLMDGARAEVATLGKKPTEEFFVTPQEVKRSFTFWTFNLGLAAQALLVTASTFHIVSLGQAAGISRAAVFALFIPKSVVSVAVNLVGGWLADRIALKYLLMALCLGLSLGTLSFLGLDQAWGQAGFILGYGLSGGLFGTLSGVTWPRYYGRKHLGAISGINMSSMVVASALGPALFSQVQAWTGAYVGALWLGVIYPLLVFLAAWRIQPPVHQKAS